MRHLIPLLVLILGVCQVAAQSADTLEAALPTVIVTAERSPSELARSTAAVSVIEPDQLRLIPTRHPVDLLTMAPGLTFLRVDGLGFEPQAVTRGFYGGGEAEYVVLLLNGRPVNNLENGLINWDRLATTPGTRIEVLRGGASSLYGDAALGAVVNVISDHVPNERTLRLQGGGFGLVTATAAIAEERFSAAGRYSDSGGFRDHAERSSLTLQGSGDVPGSPLTVSAGFTDRDVRTPGPLRSSDTAKNTSSLDFFRFDRLDERVAHAALSGDWPLAGGSLTADLSVQRRELDLTRTLPLSAEFADTQTRLADANTMRVSALLTDLSTGKVRLTVGFDASRGALDTRYYAVHTGDEVSYAAASGTRGELQSEGKASRYSAALYVHADISATERLKLTLGSRLDGIVDPFEPRARDAAFASDLDASDKAFSPKAGLNYRYYSAPGRVGNLYLSAGRSFKAPTLDQRYDLRAFPVPFPPFSIRIANPALTPQKGTSYEAGFYHTHHGLTVSGAAYTMDMTDEIDFSFETFSNVNIGKSRHRGVELGVTAEAPTGRLLANYTLQDVTHSAGEHAGNAVKAIPRHAWSVGGHANRGEYSAGLMARGHAGMWVDDANTQDIPDYWTLDVRLAWESPRAQVSLDLYNLLDRTYYSTAFGDPAGSDVQFRFPAAGRSAVIGIEFTF
ncbi:MAG: TonB-dependent receptor [Rhodothermales bacterium]|nr:TonB-dependent receptor [Rhodothermales bacterium]MBO6780810.1 TonB-dependent receptor [Rhodothermales bacterium]